MGLGRDMLYHYVKVANLEGGLMSKLPPIPQQQAQFECTKREDVAGYCI
jgi:hypothetical protein